MSRAVLPLLVKQNKGHVINIGSIAGKKFIPTAMYIVLQNMQLML